MPSGRCIWVVGFNSHDANSFHCGCPVLPGIQGCPQGVSLLTPCSSGRKGIPAGCFKCGNAPGRILVNAHFFRAYRYTRRAYPFITAQYRSIIYHCVRIFIMQRAGIPEIVKAALYSHISGFFDLQETGDCPRARKRERSQAAASCGF